MTIGDRIKATKNRERTVPLDPASLTEALTDDQYWSLVEAVAPVAAPCPLAVPADEVEAALARLDAADGE